MASKSEVQPLLSSSGASINSGAESFADDDAAVLEAGKEAEQADGHKNALGTINGCYVPCLLNIMGIVLFMRLPWATGQAGLSGILGGIGLAELMALPTVLSISAIATNGNMEGGGSYFMISRSLGPELGGAIGLLFYLAYAIGVSFYIIGFSTEVQQSWPQFSNCDACKIGNTTYHSGNFTSCSPADCVPGTLFVGTVSWTVAVIGTVSLAICLAISLNGAGSFAKMNVIFFAIQMFSIVWGIISFLVPQTGINPHGATIYDPTHPNVSSFLPDYNISWSTKRMKSNWNASWTQSPQCNHGEMCDFRLMFSIIFPMATGIMEGANLSGDQKNPEKSIPTGTLWAVLTSFITYLALVISFAGAFDRLVLLNDLNLFQNASLKTPYIVIAGILISSLSSGLGSLFGGSRILQAIARDKLYPVLNFFGYGSKKGDEPLIAVMGTWIISQGCVLIGDLDVVAPIITSIFCLSYALVNLTCFALSMSGAPNFRPMFKYWSKWTALVGFITNLFVMFFLDYKHGIIGVAVLLLLIIYLVFRGPVTQWGDVSQALMFHQVRKFLLMLSERPHAKYWRPNMLVLTDDVNSAILAFCNKIKKGGLLVVGDVIVGDLHDKFGAVEEKRARWQEGFKFLGIKAFSHVTAAPTARLGYQFLLTCGGLGGLDINTVVIPLLRGLTKAPSGTSIHTLLQDGRTSEDARNAASAVARAKASGINGKGLISLLDASLLSSNIKDATLYCAMLNDALLVRKNIVLTRGFGSKMQKTKRGWFGLPNRLGHVVSDNAADNRQNIDVWIVDDWGFDRYYDNMERCDQDVMLLFQLGQILNHKLQDSKRKLRIMYIPSVAVLDDHKASPWNPCAQPDVVSLVDGLTAYCKRMRVTPNEVNIIDPRMLNDIDEEDDIVNEALNRGMDLRARASVINDIISQHCDDTSQVFISLPRPPNSGDNDECEVYLEALRTLTDTLPPTALTLNGEHVSFVSSGI